jgi:hypothetical protein
MLLATRWNLQASEIYLEKVGDTEAIRWIENLYATKL